MANSEWRIVTLVCPTRYSPFAISSTRLGEQRELARARGLRGLVGQRRGIFAGEAMVGELRADRVAALEAHRAIDAVDRQESQRIGADEAAHAFHVMVGGEQLLA